MRRMGPDGNEVPTVAAELGAGTAAAWLLLEGGPVVGGGRLQRAWLVEARMCRGTSCSVNTALTHT